MNLSFVIVDPTNPYLDLCLSLFLFAASLFMLVKWISSMCYHARQIGILKKSCCEPGCLCPAGLGRNCTGPLKDGNEIACCKCHDIQ